MSGYDAEPEYQRIIASHGEAEVHDFLERHPGILTNTDFVFGESLVTKLPLGSDFIPDFAYVNPQSGPTYLRLFEIEDPHKRIFLKNDQFSSEFNRAYQQVEDWLRWSQKNSGLVRSVFKSMPGAGDFHFFAARGYLIYGRRSEINNPLRRDRWSHKAEGFVTVRTYDGFLEDRRAAFAWRPDHDYGVRTVVYRNRRFVRKF